MTDLQRIRELDIDTVESGHFIELGNEVVQVLRDELGDEALKSIYDVAKGDGPEGFAERFSEALERYTDLHQELFEVSETREESEPKEDQSAEPAVQEQLDDLRAHYQEMRDTHLSRNIFVSWEKLRVDIEARKNDEVGADGKYKVSGGTIAADVLGIIRGNVFETILEEVLRTILDSIFPAEKDPVVTDDRKEELTVSTGDGGKESLFVDAYGVEDTGFVEHPGEISRETVSMLQSANPLYGQHFGFDMTRDGMQNGSMVIWRGGFHQNIDTVVRGEVRTTGVPRISMVELGQNLYHVSPFGKVLNSEIRNPDTEVPIGNTISRLDIATGQRREIFEAKAAEMGCSLEELKESYTKEVQEDFIVKIGKGIEQHGAYIKEVLLPKLEQVKEDYEKDYYVLDCRETALKADLAECSGETEKELEQRKELEEKLESIAELKSALSGGIAKAEEREAALENTVELYEDCKEALSVKGADTESRYMMASNVEKDSAGRAELAGYLPKETEKEIQDVLEEEREVFLEDLERYNEAHADNMLLEKDGSIYNRYGISETGDYDPEMCEETEHPEEMDEEEQKEYISIHEEDGFSDFKDYLETGKNAMVETEQKDVENGQELEDRKEKEPADSDHERKQEVLTEETESEDMAKEDVEAVDQAEEEREPKEQAEQRKKREEGGFDGDIPDVEQAEAEDDAEAAMAEERPELDVEPEEAALGEEIKDQNEEENEEEKDTEPQMQEKEEEELYNDIVEGFREYLDNDTYSFGGDLVDAFQDVDTQIIDQLMNQALCELYIETDMSDNDRLFSLTAEVAAYSENGIMPAIEHLIDGLKERGMPESDIVMTLEDMEPYILKSMEELITISADEVEQRILRIGDDVFTITPDSVINDVTGETEDPNHLVDLVVKSINGIYGDGVGDTAAEQVMNQMDTNEGNDIDFLDRFFNGSLENTLHNMMTDLLPEEFKDAAEGTVTADQVLEGIEETGLSDWMEMDSVDEAELLPDSVEMDSGFEDL